MMKKRAYLKSIGATITAGLTAGCSTILNEYSNIANNGEKISVEPHNILISPEDLPKQERNPWKINSDDSGSRNKGGTFSYVADHKYANRTLTVRNKDIVQSMAGEYYRFLTVKIQVYNNKKDAEKKYKKKKKELKLVTPFYRISSPGFGDSSVLRTTNDEHEIIELAFRENNVFFYLEESENLGNQKEILKTATSKQAQNLQSIL